MVLRVGLGVQSLFLEALRPVEPFRRENEKRSSLVRHLQVIQLLLAKCAHDHALNRWLISFADVQMMLPGLSANRPTVVVSSIFFFFFCTPKNLPRSPKPQSLDELSSARCHTFQWEHSLGKARLLEHLLLHLLAVLQIFLFFFSSP